MRTIHHRSASILLGILLFCGISAAREPWVSGYYPGWDQQKLPPEKIPFEAITHLFHFACGIEPDGTLNAPMFELSDAHIKATVSAAHAAKKKVVIVLGGADSGKGFEGATADAVRATFIANIVAFVGKHGYDGVDIDWEPVRKSSYPAYRALVTELRAALRKTDANSLLTTATGASWESPGIGKLHAELQGEFDQINLMTYVLAGAWEGWVTWHGSALRNGGAAFSNGRPMPSIENAMADFVNAGVRREKLGIGLAFHGSVWSGGEGTDTGGVTRPQQAWKKPPVVDLDVAYSEIIRRFVTNGRWEFDPVTQSAYVSIDKPGAADDRFISFTDPAGITARLKFMTDNDFGGCIIWHIAHDTLPSNEHPLADAIIAYRKQLK